MLGISSLPEPTKVTFDDDSMWVSLADGRTIGVPLAWYPRLLNATPEARADLFLSPGGLHWDTLDEDISIETIIAGRGEHTDKHRHAA
jgi:hypothetical protein